MPGMPWRASTYCIKLWPLPSPDWISPTTTSEAAEAVPDAPARPVAVVAAYPFHRKGSGMTSALEASSSASNTTGPQGIGMDSGPGDSCRGESAVGALLDPSLVPL